MTPVPSSPVALLDQLDELRAKATPGPWHTWRDTSGVPMVCTDDVWIAEPQDNPADAALIVAAVNAVGPLAAAVRAVLEMHVAVEMWEYDDVNGVWVYDAQGEKVPLPSVCRECTPHDSLLAIGDYEWTEDYETVTHPCPTVTAITAALSVTP